MAEAEAVGNARFQTGLSGELGVELVVALETDLPGASRIHLRESPDKVAGHYPLCRQGECPTAPDCCRVKQDRVDEVIHDGGH